MPQASDVRCLTALLKAVVAVYVAVRACDTEMLEFYGLHGLEDDMVDLREDLEGILEGSDRAREG